MVMKRWSNRTLAELLGVKRSLDLTPDRGRSPADDPFRHDPAPASKPEKHGLDGKARGDAHCINCGYDQQGVRLARCPECGLPLAAFYRDPTSWSRSQANLGAWWATAVAVWTCERRLCVRASMMPATASARIFARWSVLATVVMLSLTLAIADSLTPTPGGYGPLALALRFMWAAVSIGLLLFGMQYGLARSLSGTWRQRYPFVPGSVYYATAWWPLVAGLLLCFTALYAGLPSPELLTLIGFTGVVGPLAWGLWLWASLVAAERVTLPSLRIGAAVLAVSLLGSFVAGLVPNAAQWSLGQVVAAQGGLAKVQVLKSLQTGSTSTAPRTYAVIIDMFTSLGQSQAYQIAARMGAQREHQVCMYGEQATRKNIRETLDTLRSEIRPSDRLLLYIAGHGAQEGAGAIRVHDGYVTSQTIADFVRDLKTPNTLVVIHSCFGGKFIKALRAEHVNAVVLTSTDQQNVGFQTVLRPFWSAWLKPDTDVDGDGRVSVAEAFTTAFAEMLKTGERGRQHIVNNGDDKDVVLAEESGYCTPQYEVLGKANEDVFFMPVDGGRMRD